jgi:hypothetical protein
MPVRAAVRARDPGTLVPRPDALPCDLATVSDAQKAVTVANGAALAYAGSPAMTDPTLLGRLSSSLSRRWWCGARAIRLPSQPTAKPIPLPSMGRGSRSYRPPGTCPRWENPDLVLKTI